MLYILYLVYDSYVQYNIMTLKYIYHSLIKQVLSSGAPCVYGRAREADTETNKSRSLLSRESKQALKITL